MTKTRNAADVAFIEALADLLRGRDLTEIAVTRTVGEGDRFEVRLSRHLPAALPVVAAAPQAAVAPGAAAAPAFPASQPEPGLPEDPALHPGAVTSPMVGTVYLQAEPGSPPFVTIGASVREGQTVLIIEAMKTMNQIPAPQAGVVRRILVADGSAVEYGAPLMIIE